ncbi:Cof-type HAD-IIB family hydrolase [Anaerocellum diazotrophicum]|uniref:Haloacid dehalogenase n=1 Tax=Caldicellulosiruptor diazotrophicus TaxID=2806205 RepID=A0ABM7NN20_9FIRM|nr:Cof-type HAD-IIB family hydrolase [Caldicellulosiruptor diazotrophicus]BCS81468.1 haloacid dehalogenase [Caldicellulosiruptor diazotrophicus]
MIKLIALDIDGTLLNDAGCIPQINKEFLKIAVEKYKIEIVLCTGRGASAFKITKELELPCSLISANGVYVFENPDFPPIIKNYLTEHQKKVLIEFLDNNHFDIDYYIVLGYDQDFHMIYKERTNHDNYFLNFVNGRKQFKPTYPAEKLLKFLEYPISHIGIVGKYEKLKEIKEILKTLELNCNIILYYASDNKEYGFLEVLSNNASKEKALLQFMSYKNISPENLISIGDNFNDVGMFKISGISVAVANAPEEVKKAAKFVTCKTNNEGAVAEVIERFIIKRDG